GNLDIDNLIKATHKNMVQFRLEWIPYEDFKNVGNIAEGGFSMIFTALWEKGKITSYYDNRDFNRAGPETVVLKILKDSQNINSAFIKELRNITETLPNSYKRHIIQYYGVSQDPVTKNYIFVMSHMKQGSLHEYLSKNFNDIKWTDWGKSKRSK
ncbi:4191_t:CDS:2, partial [Acaulospora morrowiae]